MLMEEGPGPDSQFIEVETDAGQSVQAGEWIERTDGYALRICAADVLPREGLTEVLAAHRLTTPRQCLCGERTPGEWTDTWHADHVAGAILDAQR